MCCACMSWGEMGNNIIIRCSCLYLFNTQNTICFRDSKLLNVFTCFMEIQLFVPSFANTRVFSRDICKQADPDQTPQNAASDQVRHRLLTEYSIEI